MVRPVTPITPTASADRAVLAAQAMLDDELPADKMLDAIAHVYDEDDKGDLK